MNLTTKCVLMTKLTCIFLTAAFLQVSASGNGQEVTFSGKDVPLKSFFSAIEKQTGYVFFYDAVLLKEAKPVSIDVKNAPLKEALDQAFARQLLTWTMVNKTITIVKKQPVNEHTGSPSPIDVKGRVVNENGEPVNATVTEKGTKNAVATDVDGNFTIKGVAENATLVITSVSIEQTLEVAVAGKTDLNTLTVKSRITTGEGVNISTGYQTISKERATGSFNRIDRQLLNRQMSSDLLTRMEGAAPGMLFNGKRYGNLLDVIIRGKATFSDYTPLIVVDNFPYEGDFNNINPQDVESITILKDAAAASIWGARAGNGVIVITTKKGSYNQKTQVQLSMNITASEKPDLFALPQMSVPDYIAFEKILFQKGLYTNLEQSPNKPALSPVAEILIANRDGLLGSTEMNMKLSGLSNRQDVREDYLRYFYQVPLTQRYALSVNGGSAHHNYYLSFGYDGMEEALRGNRSDRTSINFKNTFTPVKNLSINASALFTQYKTSITTKLQEAQYPYESLADENGNHLPVTRDYRTAFTKDAEQKGLLNWEYRPLDELNKSDNTNLRNDFLLNFGIQYDVWKGISMQLLYQWERQNGRDADRQDKDLYSVRNMVNSYSQLSGSAVFRPLPYGDILTSGENILTSHSARFQVNYNNNWKRHSLYAIAGGEARENERDGSRSVVYGYKEDGLTTNPVDYLTAYPQYYNSGIRLTIPYTNSFTGGTNRFLSLYGNAAYTYDNRFIISASARKDGANLFGVKTNQQWKPLWSTGISWQINREKFYRIAWLPYLRARLTYGFTGNVGSGSAYTTASYSVSTLTGLQYATINQPPNPGLIWEKQRTINYAIDFQAKDKVIAGSIDLYTKKGTDLIMQAPLDPTTGYFLGVNYSVTRNYARMNATGVDAEINSRNIRGIFSWQSRLLFSYTKSKIVKIYGEPTISNYLSSSSIITGNSPGEIYSYRWGGLDPANGNPIGYIDNKPVTNYTQINTMTKPSDLVKNGPSIPVMYGAIGNTFSWKKLSVTVNFLYKLGYYFRRNSFVFGLGSNHSDFAARWQKPGDEAITSVPSIPVSFDPSRNNFYSLSEVLVEKGDHVRLQYIHLNYTLDNNSWKKFPFSNAEIYLNMSNGGIVWRANKHHIDPDYPGVPASPSYTIGVRLTL